MSGPKWSTTLSGVFFNSIVTFNNGFNLNSVPTASVYTPSFFQASATTAGDFGHLISSPSFFFTPGIMSIAASVLLNGTTARSGFIIVMSIPTGFTLRLNNAVGLPKSFTLPPSNNFTVQVVAATFSPSTVFVVQYNNHDDVQYNLSNSRLDFYVQLPVTYP